MPSVLQLDPRDNALIALEDRKAGETIEHCGQKYTLVSNIPAKQKFSTENLPAGAAVKMYGVLVGKASQPISRGELLTTGNLHHQAAGYREKSHEYRWSQP